MSFTIHRASCIEGMSHLSRLQIDLFTPYQLSSKLPEEARYGVSLLEHLVLPDTPLGLLSAKLYSTT